MSILLTFKSVISTRGNWRKAQAGAAAKNRFFTLFRANLFHFAAKREAGKDVGGLFRLAALFLLFFSLKGRIVINWLKALL